MAYALFLNAHHVSDVFLTKAEAWAHAENRGLVAVFPSHDEDPPRRVLDLTYSIRLAQDGTRPVLSTRRSAQWPERGHSVSVAEQS